MVFCSAPTPIIKSRTIGRIDLLESLFGKVVIPQAVFEQRLLK